MNKCICVGGSHFPLSTEAAFEAGKRWAICESFQNFPNCSCGNDDIPESLQPAFNAGVDSMDDFIKEGRKVN